MVVLFRLVPNGVGNRVIEGFKVGKDLVSSLRFSLSTMLFFVRYKRHLLFI